MPKPNRVRLAAGACLAGAALLLVSIPLGVDGETSSPAGLVAWGAGMLLLMGGPLGLLAAGAAAGRKLGYAGAGLTVAGQATQVVGIAYIVALPATEPDQLFTPLGAQAIWLGMLLLGIACLRAKRLRGVRRFAPLAVSAYFLIQISAIQIPFYLSQGLQPSFVWLGAWGVVWALLGLVLGGSAAEAGASRARPVAAA